MDGVESVHSELAKLVNREYDSMLNKRQEQRCRILIPKSRLLFGICDPRGVLREGECSVRVTMDDGGQPQTLTGSNVLVTRNPCLHPGDVQKFRAVEKAELSHLVDCIVFSTQGRRPSADLMSGGDLDGDKCECHRICFSMSR
jgi:regulator of nonsense transcripts 1